MRYDRFIVREIGIVDPSRVLQQNGQTFHHRLGVGTPAYRAISFSASYSRSGSVKVLGLLEHRCIEANEKKGRMDGDKRKADNLTLYK